MPSRRMCCWLGCQATYEGDQPANWRHLLVFWSARPIRAFADIPDATWDRDGVLCPQHTGRSACRFESRLRQRAIVSYGPAPVARAAQRCRTRFCFVRNINLLPVPPLK